MLTRAVLTAASCTLGIAFGAGFAAGFGAPFGGALLASTAAVIAASVVVFVVLGLGDRRIFPARAQYKPTIEQLSEELTEVTSPEDVARAVERTVRRWLPCDRVELLPARREESAAEDDVAASGTRRISVPTRHEGDAELSLPLSFGGRALGVLHLGKKRGGALFTSEDDDLLRTIANQAALAFAHALSYAELERRRKDEAAAWREEKSALVETLAAEIAHEVRYPINFFRSIFRRGSNGERLDAEEVDIGCEEVERLERLVSDLRRVAARPLERRPVSLRELGEKAELLLRDRLGRRQIDIDVDDELRIRCDADHALQVLVNLLSNACDAAGEAGEIGVSWMDADGEGELVVWDTGAGFTTDASHLFAAWFTTKPGGTGLGLAITQRLIRAHGWTIEPSRERGRTSFTVTIPERDIVRCTPEDEKASLG